MGNASTERGLSIAPGYGLSQTAMNALRLAAEVRARGGHAQRRLLSEGGTLAAPTLRIAVFKCASNKKLEPCPNEANATEGAEAFSCREGHEGPPLGQRWRRRNGVGTGSHCARAG